MVGGKAVAVSVQNDDFNASKELVVVVFQKGTGLRRLNAPEYECSNINTVDIDRCSGILSFVHLKPV